MLRINFYIHPPSLLLSFSPMPLSNFPTSPPPPLGNYCTVPKLNIDNAEVKLAALADDLTTLLHGKGLHLFSILEAFQRCSSLKLTNTKRKLNGLGSSGFICGAR